MSTVKRQTDPFGPQTRLTYPGLHSWLIEPAGVLNQVLAVKLTTDVTRAITMDVDGKMKAKWPGYQHYLYVHDFTHAVGYETDARKMLIEWGKRSMAIIDQIVVVLAPDSNPIFKMGAAAGVATLRVLGVHIDLSESLADVIHKFDITLAR
jgi:hypothetical protein